VEIQKTKTVAVFTVCNIAYLPKALVLAESLMVHSNIKLKVYLFDRKQDFTYPAESIDLIWIEDIGVPKFNELAFMYDIIEFSTSLKPFISLNLLQKYDSVVFLDPDTCLFAPLTPILEELGHHDILLTPHHTKPQPRTPEESDLPMMRFGSFNLGFFAVNNQGEGLDFLNWWNERCIDHCFMESQFGLSTDQKWVTIAPCFFRTLHVCFHPGYNASAWNTFERTFSKNDLGQYMVNDDFPLVFFHFSNFDYADTGYLNKRASSERGLFYPVLKELGDWYADRLKAKSELVSKVRYSYDFMSDGTFISPTLRRAYASVRAELPVGHEPFDSNGPVGKFAKKNHLVGEIGGRYSYPGLRDAKKHQGKFRAVYALMRLILRIVGPNRFYDLSKLVVYLSMYRRNRDLWKI